MTLGDRKPLTDPSPRQLKLLKKLLELTAQGHPSFDELVEATKAPPAWLRQALERLREEGLRKGRGQILLDAEQRVGLMVKACELGGDVEDLGRLLEWREFEFLIQKALEASEFQVVHSFRFSHNRRRWEVDLVALKNPLMLCVDCKHLTRRQGTALRKAAERNILRAQSLGRSLEAAEHRLGLETWKKVVILPVIVSLMPADFQESLRCPVVPILRFRDFLMGLPSYASDFRSFCYSRGRERGLREQISDVKE